MSGTPAPPSPNADVQAWRRLCWLAIGQGILYATIAWLSRDFTYGENHQQRPILAVIALFVACFVLYVGSLGVALRLPPTRPLSWSIVAGALLFRVVLLFSQPIQEVDVYRYLWDGAVTTQGINPYRFAPAEIPAAESHEHHGDNALPNQTCFSIAGSVFCSLSPASSDPPGEAACGGEGGVSAQPIRILPTIETHALPNQLQQLVDLRDASPAMQEIHRRIHYARLATLYPPVSQAVFALASSVTPVDAPLATHVTVMKAVILLFDLATIGLIGLLLTATGRHPAWAIAYAWCPLVMKEFANSGHLDAVAVCLTTAAIWRCARLYVEPSRPLLKSFGAAVLLGLAVGAKLYPIVLLPLMTVVIARRSDLRGSLTFAMTALIVSALTLMPIFVVSRADPAVIGHAGGSPSLPDGRTASMSSPEPRPRVRPPSGLSAFLSRWEMNDLVFLIVVENLRPTGVRPDEPEPWFAVVPDSCRQALVTPVSRAFSMNEDDAAFLLARALTSLVFLAIVVWTLAVVIRNDTVSVFLEAAFLTLAWFWLLSPTQNPWYWTWPLPLLAFARGRAWMAVSGLVFAYYLRFWLLYHWPDQPVPGTPYDGASFFNFVVPWLEFGPWLLWLAVAMILRHRGDSPHQRLREL